MESPLGRLAAHGNHEPFRRSGTLASADGATGERQFAATNDGCMESRLSALFARVFLIR